MQAKLCEKKGYLSQFMQKLCNYLPQIEFTSFKISISRRKWLRKLTSDAFVYSLSIFSKLLVPKCPISWSLLDFSDPLVKVNFIFYLHSVFGSSLSRKGLIVFGSSFFSNGSINKMDFAVADTNAVTQLDKQKKTCTPHNKC